MTSGPTAGRPPPALGAARHSRCINDDAHQWGWTDGAITGDPRVYGRVYVSTNGRGVVYGDTSDTTGGGGTGGGGGTDPTPTGACSVTYKVTNQWSGGFQAHVQLTNTGASAWGGLVTRLDLRGRTEGHTAVERRLHPVGRGGDGEEPELERHGGGLFVRGLRLHGELVGGEHEPASLKLGDRTCTVA